MKRSLTILLILALTGCSGGGGGGADSGGIGGSGITRGIVTRLGSATVAGTRYTTTGAEFEFDRVLGTEADVALGMKLTVEGTRDTNGAEGVATRLVFDDDIEGPVSEILVLTPDRKELSILAQTVVLERNGTLFEGGIDFDTIDVDDVVEVSGLRGTAAIEATRVVLKTTLGSDPTPPVELKGEVSGLVAGEFQIGSVTVLFDVGTTDLSDVPGGVLTEGDFVEVEGTLAAADRVDATQGRIEIEVLTVSGDVNDFEIEGLVSSFSSLLTPFRVSGQLVDASNFGVLFEPANASFVEDGARVEVEGRLISGLLVADLVRFRDAEVRIEAQITADADVDAAAGTIRLLGAIDVQVVPSTRLEDFTDVGDLGLGDFLEVRGVVVAGVVEATRVKLESSVEETRLQGRVESFDSGGSPKSFTILDVPIDTDDETDFDDIPGVETEDQFYAFLAGFTFPQALLDAKETEDERVHVAAEIADNADIDLGADMLTLLGVVDISFDQLDSEDFVACSTIPGFDGLEDVAAGDFLRIDGIRLSGGVVEATRVRCEDAAGDVELQGPVDAVDGGAGTFTVLGVLVPTDVDTVLTGFPSVSDEAGFYALTGDRLSAMVDVPVVVTDDADGDATTLDVADEVAEVRGFLADEVEPVDETDEVKVAAEIADNADVDLDENQLTLLGTLVVSFDDVLSFQACSVIPILDNLAAGDFVIIEGIRLPGGVVRATTVRCEDSSGDVELLGRVEAFDSGATEVTVLGVLVDTNSATDFESFPGVGMNDEAGFYAFLAANPTAVIEVKDDQDGDATAIDVANEVEFEDDGD